MKRKDVIKIVIIAVAISLGLAFVVNLLFKIHSSGLLSAEWDIVVQLSRQKSKVFIMN